MRVAAIIPSAGVGKRLGAAKPKPFVRVQGKPLLCHTIERLSAAFKFEEFIVASNPKDFSAIQKYFHRYRIQNGRLVPGGVTRAQSVLHALKAVSSLCDWVLVHDAARPLVSDRIVRDTLAQARRTGGAIAALPVTSTVKRLDVSRRMIQAGEDRNSLFLAQTPQVFRRIDLLKAYEELGPRAVSMTDEAALFEGTPLRVAVVQGEARNLKVTTPEDLDLFKFYLSRRSTPPPRRSNSFQNSLICKARGRERGDAMGIASHKQTTKQRSQMRLF